MLSANEAKRKTQSNINNCVTSELEKLDMQISEAISNGKFSICNDGVLSLVVQKKLATLGYKIKTGSQYNESYYSISWE